MRIVRIAANAVIRMALLTPKNLQMTHFLDPPFWNVPI